MIQRTLRIVFMGTPAFAVPTLQYLLDASYPVTGVVTAPDKPGGRGMKQMISSPVKQFTLTQGLPILQPVNLKSKTFIQELQLLRADVQIVVAFRMLPEMVWAMPPQGTINLHGSLLPAYRGAAPIQWAIVRGEKVTGLTTFFLQHAIDTGKILLQVQVPIIAEDDAGSLHDRMMITGAGLVLATLDQMTTGQLNPQEQDESKTSHAPKIFHADARIDWVKPAETILNLIRGMSPYPGAWTLLDDMELKIWRATSHAITSSDKPGTMRKEGKKLIVSTQGQDLEILTLQLSGKKKMDAGSFLNGYAIRNWSLT